MLLTMQDYFVTSSTSRHQMLPSESTMVYKYLCSLPVFSNQRQSLCYSVWSVPLAFILFRSSPRLLLHYLHSPQQNKIRKGIGPKGHYIFNSLVLELFLSYSISYPIVFHASAFLHSFLLLVTIVMGTGPKRLIFFCSLMLEFFFVLLLYISDCSRRTSNVSEFSLYICVFLFVAGVDISKSINVAYVPSHLYHICFELIKVSFIIWTLIFFRLFIFS